ncbi:MAG: hypothetical protein D6791_15755 [Chloroflexi bacterium]|nr:MAG: hypothetical protein D6791_15755 [Chloroflexota bacterium]
MEYPEVLARLPAACAYLRERPDVDKHAIVLVGVGIGGDLALRTAATDPAIAAVTAIDPVLNPEATGLDLLRRSTFWQAMRWGKLRRRLAGSLSAAERLLQLKERPALLVFRADSAPAGEIAAGNHAEVAIVHSDDEAIQRVARWLTTVTMNSKDVTRYQTVLPAK